MTFTKELEAKANAEEPHPMQSEYILIFFYVSQLFIKTTSINCLKWNLNFLFKNVI